MAEYYGFYVGRPSVRSSVRSCVLSFLDDILSNYQWIFTKLYICIDIVEVWFGIANGKFLSFSTELSACHMSVFSFPDDSLSK